MTQANRKQHPFCSTWIWWNISSNIYIRNSVCRTEMDLSHRDIKEAIYAIGFICYRELFRSFYRLAGSTFTTFHRVKMASGSSHCATTVPTLYTISKALTEIKGVGNQLPPERRNGIRPPIYTSLVESSHRCRILRYSEIDCFSIWFDIWNGLIEIY